MKKPYYIDYRQVPFEGHAHRYLCADCKVETTTINGQLSGHLATCAYRLALEKAGYESSGACQTPASSDADDVD